MGRTEVMVYGERTINVELAQGVLDKMEVGGFTHHTREWQNTPRYQRNTILTLSVIAPIAILALLYVIYFGETPH